MVARTKIQGLLVSATVLVAAAAAAPAALAYTQPTFATTGQFIYAKSTSTQVLAHKTADTITCTGVKTIKPGSISGTSVVTGIKLEYTGCSGKTSLETCTGGKSIKTEELTGELGEVAAAEASSEVGLLFAPPSGSNFATFVCKNNNVTATGTTAGEVKEVEKGREHSGKVIFTPNTEKIAQVITKIFVGAGGIEKVPALTAFGVGSSLSSSMETEFCATETEANEVVSGTKTACAATVTNEVKK